MINLILKTFYLMISVFLVILLSNEVEWNSSLENIQGVFLLLVLVRLASLLFTKAESNGPFFLVYNLVFPIIDRVLSILLLVSVLLQYYLEFSASVLLILALGITSELIARKVENLIKKIKIETYQKPKKVAIWMKVSREVFLRLKWPVYLVFVSLLFPMYLGTVLLVLLIAFAPYLYNIFFKLKNLVEFKNGASKRSIRMYVESYRPEVIFYCAGHKGSAYQLKQWLDVLNRCGKRVLIIVRERHFFLEFYNTHLPIFLAKNMGAIDLFLTNDTKIVLYPANSAKNSHFFRWSHLKHIFVNHGESDKVVNVSKFLRSYDKLYVAGQLAIDRIRDAGLGIDDKRFELVGRPQTDLALDKGVPAPKNRIRVLYAPTWEGFSEDANYTSINSYTLKALQTMLANPNIVLLFKPHPYTGIVSQNVKRHLNDLQIGLAQLSNVEIFGNDKNIHDLMNESNCIITDVSSVLNDYLYTEKPIIISNPRSLSLTNYHSNFYSSKAAYILSDNWENLDQLLRTVTTMDPLKDERLKVARYSLGHWPQGAMERFKEQLDLDYSQDEKIV